MKLDTKQWQMRLTFQRFGKEVLKPRHRTTVRGKELPLPSDTGEQQDPPYIAGAHVAAKQELLIGHDNTAHHSSHIS